MENVSQEIEYKANDLEQRIEDIKNMSQNQLQLSIQALKAELQESLQLSQEPITELVEKLRNDFENYEARF